MTGSLACICVASYQGKISFSAVENMRATTKNSCWLDCIVVCFCKFIFYEGQKYTVQWGLQDKIVKFSATRKHMSSNSNYASVMWSVVPDCQHCMSESCSRRWVQCQRQCLAEQTAPDDKHHSHSYIVIVILCRGYMWNKIISKLFQPLATSVWKTNFISASGNLPGIISKLFHRLIAAHNVFQRVHCRWNNVEIIFEFLQRLK